MEATATEDDFGINAEQEFGAAFINYKQTFGFSQQLRNKLVNKLDRIVDKMEIDPNQDKASALDAKRGYIESTLGAIRDIDKHMLDDVKLKQKMVIQKQHEETADLGNAIVDLLSSITARGVIRATGDLSNVDDLIKDKLEANDEVADIQDGELLIDKNVIDVDEVNSAGVEA